MYDIKGTNYIALIYCYETPKDQKVAYAKIVCSMHPQKKKTYYACMTIRSNLLDYDRNTKTPAADLITLKLLLNSVLSILEAKFMIVDITFLLRNKT